MNRLAWISVVVLAGITSLLAADLLDPDPVPIARAVELTGTVPTDRPAPDGFFIVPPRVVDFRDDQEESDESDDSSDTTGSSVPENSLDDASQGPGDSDADDDPEDDDADDSPDDLDDEDDSVDDDD